MSLFLTVFSDEGRSTGTNEHMEYAGVRTPTATPSSPKILVFIATRSKQALTTHRKTRRCTEEMRSGGFKVALRQQFQYLIAQHLRTSYMLSPVSLQDIVLAAFLSLCTGQFGVFVTKLAT
jgi:hypothetical protein